MKVLSLAFEEITSRINNNAIQVHPELSTCPSDRTKITLHRMFMHKNASEHPNATHDHIVVEDSFQGHVHETNPAIIDGLRHVYTQNPDLIPQGTRLITVPYDGKINRETISIIDGTSDNIDRNYLETTTPNKTYQCLLM